MYTPWGQSDHTETLAKGIIDCSTPRHGGIRLSAERIARLPAHTPTSFLRDQGWWEEDCDWSIPYIVFYADILAAAQDVDHVRQNYAIACKVAAQFHPDFYAIEFAQVETV